jgi:uncharacterized protein YjbI with pentapeptide repeats
VSRNKGGLGLKAKGSWSSYVDTAVSWLGPMVIILFLSSLAALLAFLLTNGYLETGFAEYSPPSPETQRAKTLWDWMELLLVPAVLALVGAGATWMINTRQQEAEERRKKADQWLKMDSAQESALQAYLDRMAQLLLEQQLLTSTNDVMRHVASVRTTTTLRQLDGVRKGLLLRFLYDSGLIGREAIIELRRADLRSTILEKGSLKGASLMEVHLNQANLERTDLEGASLKGAILRDVNLGGANLEKADLRDAQMQSATLIRARFSDAVLTEVNLIHANLDRADLTRTDLGGADLRGAILKEANLKEANLAGANVTDEQLAQAKSLEDATMPDGTKHE